MNNTLGIDLGTHSIGWAIRNPDLQGNQTEKVGVIRFNEGVGSGKAGEYSYAGQRTTKRAARRLNQARKYRIWTTLDHLISEGYCPLSKEDLNNWRHYNKGEVHTNKNAGRVYPIDNFEFANWVKLDFDQDNAPDYKSPYQLRKELVTIKLSFSEEKNRHKLGRALYHIAQRRGFKSSRKETIESIEELAADEKEIDLQVSEKKKNRVISELFEKYPAAKTIGHLYALLEDDNVRIRENISQYAIRENYKDEIKHIFEFQELGLEHPLYKQLVEEKKNKNDGSIFYKRPLRSQKGLIGKCTLEANKYRVPVSHPAFEKYRAWSFLNNIQYRTQGQGWQNLPLALKEMIFKEKFFRKSKVYFPFSEIIELLLKKGYHWTYNYSPKTTVTGCPVSARLKEIFGENYNNIEIEKTPSSKTSKNYYNLEDIWHVLFSYEDQECVVDFAEQRLQLPPDKAKLFVAAWNAMPVGYGMLSLNAINKINHFLIKGLIYTEAVLLANIPYVIGPELWEGNETLFLNAISTIIETNREQKLIVNIVNNLVSKHKSLDQKFGYKNNDYKLDDQDHSNILGTIIEVLGQSKWDELPEEKRSFVREMVTGCYQAYFRTTGLVRKDIRGQRHFEVKTSNHTFYKSDSGYYTMPKLINSLTTFIQDNFIVSEKKLSKVYHPSEINIYPAAKPGKDQVTVLGSPKTDAFRNPMAMRALHELRKLINYLITTGQIDSETRVVVEVARELNDANKRWAIETWQKQREAENEEFRRIIEELVQKDGIQANSQSEKDIDKIRLWYEQNGEETVPPLTDERREIKGIRWTENKKDSYKQISLQKSMIEKYRLWKEQECQCIYTGKVIPIAELFNSNVVDFEHTIPRSISFDNSLANQTVCYAYYNRTIKKNLLPFHLPDYEGILSRLEKWEEKVNRIKQQLDFWRSKSKKAIDKTRKDEAIRQRHLWQMELDYWQNKVNRFTIKEVTTGFKNRQKIDTQLISKYAFHYLKSYFEKVEVQKGSITAEFRKIYSVQSFDEKKDRSKHSHHAKDAAILTLIPVAGKRDEILREYYECKERHQPFSNTPYPGFRREYVMDIDDNILINNVKNNQMLSIAKKKIRKRGKEVFIPGTNTPMWATGDCIRGQLHQETFYGAIKPAKRDEKGILIKDEEGKFVQENEIQYVLRVPFEYKKDAGSVGFKTLEEVEKKIVDVGLKEQIRKQVNEAGSLKEAFEKGIYMLDKEGNKVNKIRHIRIWVTVVEPLKIKKHTHPSRFPYKQDYYAANATNSYFAIYKGEGRKGYDVRSLFQTANILSLNKTRRRDELFESSKSIIKGKKTHTLHLSCVLERGTKVIFSKGENDDLASLEHREILKRLYVLTKFEKDGRLNFRYHLEARNDIKDVYTESELDFTTPKPTLRFSYSKYDFWVEGYDFNINMDGSITFNTSKP
ncbi:type II CRISPR RNA-guided endonuclease Cas9 [Chitinophaga sancti]|uniref:CRISPR-associated endonuclease Csn1 n=1 Tax=Chitinophaga sancti TaxID=1004 RepID=A0A1K1QHS9_9BACT|nr:type II CRISPR RNA-guided endonuclease Cas9 [Chitinophaga sancti]WQD65282.1 HNH endonuclease domain-containing protein [Chitinophaga sancti]WQG89094.1 HNH endonuclease domain-containing protein [Chitinophaga sancti]SFW59225.1 CRISPR-associated endonuclease Csn1 [Chitinophaga sancti]